MNESPESRYSTVQSPDVHRQRSPLTTPEAQGIESVTLGQGLVNRQTVREDQGIPLLHGLTDLITPQQAIKAQPRLHPLGSPAKKEPVLDAIFSHTGSCR